ncbi:transposase [Gilliamella sp. Occ3-1]|uniref:transposase n=1 Tax=unclassified Gilliamella TaxID=2685620 RepID=UPI00080EB2DA|nr:transposase [Gilliamella apicola]OCG71093.1 hypothetical protein A9G43_06120 [Gilliamella apicola]
MTHEKIAEHQIVSILKEAEFVIRIKELCRKYGMGNSTFYKWREKYGGIESSDIKHLAASRRNHKKAVVTTKERKIWAKEL